jgi:hypothetical protein
LGVVRQNSQLIQRPDLAPLLLAVESQAPDVNLAGPLPACSQGLVGDGILRQLWLICWWWGLRGVTVIQGLSFWRVFIFLRVELDWGLGLTGIAVRVLHLIILSTISFFRIFTSSGGL